MADIQIIKKGITEIEADAIVNAANTLLLQGGGVCGYIFKAAGSLELTKACQEIGHCDTGKAVITPGFHSKAKYIIHAVGPIYQDGSQGESKLLYSCYYESLKLAKEYNCKEIVFPLISAGIFGYPKKEAWQVAIQAINDYFKENKSCNIKVIFSILDDRIIKIGKDVLENSIEQEPQDNFVFFWHEYEENGCFSQWYDRGFDIEGIHYATAEQYMMSKKALLFKDTRRYNDIMAESNPKRCKRLGQEVHPYDDSRWLKACEEVIYNGNYAKFTQNEDLKELLLSTDHKILAEASPYDHRWGIGLDASDKDAKHPEKWQGSNLLGKALMKVRDRIRLEDEFKKR